jgi:hypothetical protein
MRVICVEPSHRLVVVDTLERLEDGSWESGGSVRWSERGHPRGVRRRSRFECRKCGLNAEATGPVLAAVLDPLADAGISQISLRRLAGTLANLGGHLS